MCILDSSLVFSASLDRTLRVWRLEPGMGFQVDQVEDHTDYVQCLCVEAGWVATGGQGDKKIMVYRHNILGKLSRSGKTAIFNRILILPLASQITNDWLTKAQI